ncbi:MAG TPA: hypothetical protein VFX97_17690 [Pyrinomonadaceae bacterium]|nr:hypothetical protein [Pyrinomonadaceae bacterium]
MTTAASNIESQSFVDTFEEGLRYFMGEGELNKTVTQLGSDLERNGIEYMVIGAVALTAHGYPRFTADVDLVFDNGRIGSLPSRTRGAGLLDAVQRGTSFQEQS